MTPTSVRRLPRTLIAIIADAEESAHSLRLLLDQDAGVRVAAECGTGTAAIDAIHRFRPDIAFIAVRLPLMNGLEVARSVAPSAAPGFVFLTSTPSHALAAFSLNALDCLPVPVDAQRLAQTLRRARRRLTPNRVSALMLNAVAESLRDVKRIIHDGANTVAARDRRADVNRPIAAANRRRRWRRRRDDQTVYSSRAFAHILSARVSTTHDFRFSHASIGVHDGAHRRRAFDGGADARSVASESGHGRQGDGSRDGRAVSARPQVQRHD